MLLAVCHTEADGWREVHDLDTLSDLREEAGNVLWAIADVNDLTPSDVDVVAEEFGLHELAVEDALNTRQRPKIERYGTHYFIVFHQLDETEGEFEASQISCFAGDRYVLTIHDGAHRSVDSARKRLRETDRKLDSPAFVIHALLDVVVDDYQEKANQMEDEMETLEETVLENPIAPIQRQLYSLKQRLSRLRRYVLPGARLLEWVDHPSETRPFSEITATLFRDVHDHLLRMGDQIRNIDDLAQAVLDLTRSEQAIMLNLVSRKLSAWAAIFAVETLIAGIYGMNFELVPASGSLLGFWFALALMVASGIALYVFFKRRDWI